MGTRFAGRGGGGDREPARYGVLSNHDLPPVYFSESSLRQHVSG